MTNLLLRKRTERLKWVMDEELDASSIKIPVHSSGSPRSKMQMHVFVSPLIIKGNVFFVKVEYLSIGT